MPKTLPAQPAVDGTFCPIIKEACRGTACVSHRQHGADGWSCTLIDGPMLINGQPARVRPHLDRQTELVSPTVLARPLKTKQPRPTAPMGWDILISWDEELPPTPAPEAAAPVYARWNHLLETFLAGARAATDAGAAFAAVHTLLKPHMGPAQAGAAALGREPLPPMLGYYYEPAEAPLGPPRLQVTPDIPEAMLEHLEHHLRVGLASLHPASTPPTLRHVQRVGTPTLCYRHLVATGAIDPAAQATEAAAAAATAQANWDAIFEADEGADAEPALPAP